MTTTRDDTPLLPHLAKGLRVTIEPEADQPGVWNISELGLTINAPKSGDNDSDDWQLWKATIIPGVRTFPNGDPGYPDDVDVALAYEATTLEELFKKAIGPLIMEGVWESAIDVVGAELAEQAEKEAEEYWKGRGKEKEFRYDDGSPSTYSNDTRRGEPSDDLGESPDY